MANVKHEKTGEFFDRIADDYAARSEGKAWNTSSLSFARRRELVERAMGQLPANGLVLDYGMGPAVFADYVAGQCRYLGIDISQKMIDMAEAKGLENCTYRKGDLSMLSDYRSQADTVLLIGLIDYLDDPFDGLRALAECVKPGGALIMSFRNRLSLPFFLRESAKKLWRALRGGRKDADRAFDADVLENAFSARGDLVPHLRSLGFDDFELHYLDSSPIFFRVNLHRWLWKLSFSADKLLSRRCLSVFAASGVLKATKERTTSRNGHKGDGRD